MNIEQEKALREVMAADFFAFDLALYLNTHPYEQRALALFQNIVQRARILADNYQRLYGPLTAHNGIMGGRWAWAESAWPWETQ